MANTNPGNPQVSVRLDPEVYEHIKEKAQSQTRSKASVARQYILKGMTDKKREGKGQGKTVPA